MTVAFRELASGLRWGVIFSAALVTTASAGALGPSKATTLVNVTAFFTSCQTKGQKAFEHTTTAGGVNLTFSIPEKKVFVATTLTAQVTALAADQIAQVFVLIEFEDGSTSNGLIAAYTGPANGAGIGTVNLVLPTGAAFDPPENARICIGAFPGLLESATMNGYFAPAK